MPGDRFEVRPIGAVYGVWDRLRQTFVLFTGADEIADDLCRRLEGRWSDQVQRYRRQEHRVCG